MLINAKQNAFFLSYNVCALILSANIVILLLYYSYFSPCLVYRDNSEVNSDMRERKSGHAQCAGDTERMRSHKKV